MDPSIIARAFNDGKAPEDLTAIMFVRCAAEWSVEEIISKVPVEMESYFRTFILDFPDTDVDVPIIGLDGLVLKKAWILGFKAYYSRA